MRSSNILVASLLAMLVVSHVMAYIPNCPKSSVDGKGKETCDSCYAGYYLTEENTVCAPCSKGCRICTSEKECHSCQNRFFLSEGSCNQCGLTCSQCTKDGCERCDFGFYLKGKACYECAAECSVCREDGVTCLQCNRGFMMDTTQKKCFGCIENCIRCSTTSNCFECALMHIMTSNPDGSLVCKMDRS